MSYEDTPLTPEQRTLRKVVGQDGDTGVEAHAKLDRIKSDTYETLADTSTMQPLIGLGSSYVTGTVGGDTTLIHDLIQIADGNIDEIEALLRDAGFGVAAIKAAIDLVQADTTNLLSTIGAPRDADIATDIENVQTVADATESKADTIISLIGTTATGISLGADNSEIISKIDQMQNNTRTTVAMLSEMEVPAAGNEYFLVQLNNFDSVGNMESLNSLPTVTVKTFGGVDRSDKLVDDTTSPSTTMEFDSAGRYHIRYKVESTATVNEGLLFSFTLKEGTPEVERVIDRVSRVVEEVSSTFTATDRVTLGDVLDDTILLTETQLPAVDARLVATQSTVTNNYLLNQAIDAKVDAAAVELDSIKNKDINDTFDSSTDSLEAISERIDVLSTDITGINAISSVTQSFKAKTTSGNIGQGDSELVVLNTTHGVRSADSKIVLLKVIPGVATSTNFTVEVFEDAAATILFARFEKAKATKGDLSLRLNLNYYNNAGLSEIYVRITNVTDSSSPVFNVEVRGDIISLQ